MTNSDKMVKLVKHRGSYQCQVCDYISHSSYDLKRHVNDVHMKIKNHKCNLCEYAVSTSANLTRHVKGVHEQNKDHRCNIVNLQLAQPIN